jgi:N-acetylmuramoyl-L-alanine amidase
MLTRSKIALVTLMVAVVAIAGLSYFLVPKPNSAPIPSNPSATVEREPHTQSPVATTPLLDPTNEASTPLTSPAPPPALGPLGTIPDWSQFEAYQGAITRQEFERLLTTIFTTGEAWRQYIELTDSEAVITTGAPGTGLRFHLRFATPGAENPLPRHWKSGRELPQAPAERPLEGLKLAIDPGHLGGPWAKMEERWFSVGGAPPVCEGDLTLAVARLMKPKLEELGATVSLVRNSSDPITPLRPETLLRHAADAGDSTADLQRLSERLFYRTAEIRARADLVNRVLKPDLVICLHFNAEAWGNAANPTLIDRTHLHLLLNGGYTDEEVALSDQRFEMLRKLLDGTHSEEAAIGADVAAAFYAASGLPPYLYKADSKTARPVDGNPYLWARNLLANRLYNCPVIFMEPYVMNSRQDYERIQAGDYEGLRMVGGKMQPSIFREYADAVVDGLKRHYSKVRPAESEPTSDQ